MSHAGALAVAKERQGSNSMILIHEERGQGLAEYALVILLVAIVVVLIVAIYGTQIANMYSRVTNQVP
jgi:pilus assembly protein Flp/PilA